MILRKRFATATVTEDPTISKKSVEDYSRLGGIYGQVQPIFGANLFYICSRGFFQFEKKRERSVIHCVTRHTLKTADIIRKSQTNHQNLRSNQVFKAKFSQISALIFFTFPEDSSQFEKELV